MASPHPNLEALTATIGWSFARLARHVREEEGLAPATLARRFGMDKGCGHYLKQIEAGQNPSPRIVALYCSHFPYVRARIFYAAYFRMILDYHYRKLRRDVGRRRSLSPVPYPHLKTSVKRISLRDT